MQPSHTNHSSPPPRQTTVAPCKLIFDTDMGNDVDDAFALAIVHALQDREEVELLAVTVTKDEELAAPFVDVINHFYGRGDIPIGVVRDGKTKDRGRYTMLAEQRKPDGSYVYPHRLHSGSDAPEATELLRRTLAAAEDRSVTIIQIGFFTNLARLLESPADEWSPLCGRDLVERKVHLLSAMAGAFAPVDGNPHYGEYNVVNDIPSAQMLVTAWPTPIVFSGFEVGLAIRFPTRCLGLKFGYAEHHPVAETKHVYWNDEWKPADDHPTWDLTSVLYAVYPTENYFGVSEPGWVRFNDEGHTVFTPDAGGRHHYLKVSAEQVVRVQEAFIQLASQPPRSFHAGRRLMRENGADQTGAHTP